MLARALCAHVCGKDSHPRAGVPKTHIKRMGAEDNFWASGPTGPCGPCSELYYDFHPERGLSDVDLDDDSRFIEFYNLVFMELNRDASGATTPLENKNIDTGMGLERMAQILQQVPNNYECDLLRPIMARAEELSGAALAQMRHPGSAVLRSAAPAAAHAARRVQASTTPRRTRLPRRRSR